jgi:hypothetical protein
MDRNLPDGFLAFDLTPDSIPDSPNAEPPLSADQGKLLSTSRVPCSRAAAHDRKDERLDYNVL